VREQLYTPVLGDVLDQVGRRHQFLPPAIVPIRTDFVLAGRAMPVLVADVFGPQAKPYGLLTEALDQLRPGEVYLAHGGRAEAAMWGEILTVTAKLRGAVGAVIDGFHRDTPQVLTHDWPVFSRGAYAPDSGPRASVVDFRMDVEIGTVWVSPGDLVVGDRDGVVVVPRAVEDEVLALALTKVAAENEVLKAIENGMSSTEAFARFGVL
jgi:4-hydroxy-4-methyl-2-oxoglutarate aldolase